MTYKILIGGCRDFADYSVFKKYVDIYLSQISKDNDIIIISGHCSGVDTMAEKYAKDNNYKVQVHPADWNKYGRAAGPIRNKEMADECDYAIAFWDGKSKGTKSMISLVNELNKPIKIKLINKNEM